MKIIKSCAIVGLLWPFCFLWAQIDQAETHLRLCPNSLDSLVENLEMDEIEPESFQNWYLESSQMELNQANVVLRIRSFSKKPAELTLKVFLDSVSEIDSTWFDNEDFKCEKDFFGNHSRIACSLKSKIKNFLRLQNEPILLTKVLNKDQKSFLKMTAPNALDINSLQLLGPVQVEKLEDKEENLDLEIWQFKDKSFDIELSQKIEISEANASLDFLKECAQSSKVPICRNQTSKTKEALKKLLGI